MSTIALENEGTPIKPRKTSITVQVPVGFEESFHHAYRAFMDGIFNSSVTEEGKQTQDQSVPPSLRAVLAESNARSEIETRGAEALRVLWAVANGHSGQCRFIAAFLLGLYNGARFPFDLTDLRCIDSALYEHCSAVLHMDARVCEQEIYLYFEDGGTKFEQLAKDWQLTDHMALQHQLKTYRERFGPLDIEEA